MSLSLTLEGKPLMAFHLRNREAKRSLQVSWNGVDLENTDTPKYLGVTLDRTLSYKTHIHNTKMKVATRNNLLKKLANSMWGTNARTIRTTALAICYSTAEYAAPVWERSAYAHLLNPELTGMPSHYWMSKANKRRKLVFARGNCPSWNQKKCMCKSGKNQTGRERETHSLFGHTPARRRLKSRRSFLTSVQPVHFPAKVVRVNEWKRRLEEKAHAGLVNLYEDLATGHDSPWLNWRCLNRLRTGYTCSKEQRKKWGYFNGDTTCECGLATENTSHMLQCTLLAHPCTLDDLLEFNDTAQACIERWKKIAWWYDMMMMTDGELLMWGNGTLNANKSVILMSNNVYIIHHLGCSFMTYLGPLFIYINQNEFYDDLFASIVGEILFSF